MKKRLLVCLALAFCALSGCGGGESKANSFDTNNGPDSSPADSGPTKVTVRSIGQLPKHAEVAVYSVDENFQRADKPLGKTETGNTGSFELEFIHSGGMVEFELSTVTGQSRLTCLANRCGDARHNEEIALPPDYALSAIVAIPPGTNVVTPALTIWSTMAARRAKSLRRADNTRSVTESVQQANAEVSQIIGYDLRQVEHHPSTDEQSASESEALHAVMTAASNELLFRLASTNGLSHALRDFTQALAGDGIIGSADDNFRLADLAGAVRQVVRRTPELEEPGREVLANLTAQFDLAENEGFAPGFNNALAFGEQAATADKIQAFQHFTSQIRTWISSIEGLDSDQLMSVVSVDAETIQTIVDSDVQSRFQFLGEVLEQVIVYVVNHPHRVEQRMADGAQEVITIRNDNDQAIGEVRLTFSDDQGVRVAMIGEMTGAASGTFLPFNLALSTSLSVSELVPTEPWLLDQASATRLARLLAESQLNLSGTIEDGYGNPALNIDELRLAYALSPAVGVEGTNTMDMPGLFKSAHLLGDVVIYNRGARFSGAVDINLARLGSAVMHIENRTGPIFSEKFRLHGDFSSADGNHTFSTSIMAHIKSASVFDSFSWMEYNGDRRYVSGALEDTESIFALAGPKFDDIIMPGFLLDATFDPVAGAQGSAHFLGYSRDDEQRFQLYLACLQGQLDRDAFNRNSNWDFDEAADYAEAHCALTHLEVVRQETTLNSEILEQLRVLATRETEAELLNNTYAVQPFVVKKIYAYGKSTDGAGHFTAQVQVPNLDIVSNFQDMSFTVSSRMDFPELRSAQVSATIRRNRHGRGKLRADIKWNGGSYTAVVQLNDVNAPTEAHIQLFNAQGYELDIRVARAADTGAIELSGTASIEGEPIGHVERRASGLPLIIYPNGNEEIIESLY